MMAAPVTRTSHRSPPRARNWLGAAALLLLSACYGGDFLDRLVDPDIEAAFRITSMTLIDPHFYDGGAVCEDATLKYNQIWTTHLGKYEINPILVLSPLDPAVETATKIRVIPATCIAVGDINCSDVGVPEANIVEAVFNNSLQGGKCGGPIMGSLNPLYDVAKYEPLSSPESPCFLSALIPAVKLPLGPKFSLPLSNVQISAAYSLEEEPQRLIEGLIVGYLPAALANSDTLGMLGTLTTPFKPWDVLAGGNSCQPDVANPINDLDIDDVNNGVWIYFNFTAERVAWMSESSTNPPTDTSPTSP